VSYGMPLPAATLRICHSRRFSSATTFSSSARSSMRGIVRHSCLVRKAFVPHSEIDPAATICGMPLDVLSINLKALMRDYPEWASQRKLALKAGIDQRTVGRILNMEHSPNLAQIDKLAEVFNVQPWQLLAPNLGAGLYSVDLQPMYRQLPARPDKPIRSIDSPWTAKNHPARRATDKQRK
jgi:transcriptional regulator with XRE-family HTH domain